VTSLRLAWLELSRHRGVTLLALLTLGMSVGCAGLLFRMWRLADARFARLVPAGDAIVGAKAGQIDMLLGCLNLEGPYPGFIPYRLYETLLNRDRIGVGEGEEVKVPVHKAIVPILFCGKYRGHRLIGTNDVFLRQGEWGAKVALEKGRWCDGENETVIGSDVSRREGLLPGDDAPVEPWTSGDSMAQSVIPRRLKVTGVLRRRGDAWDGALFTGMATASRLLSTGATGDAQARGPYVLHYMLVYLQEGGLRPLRDLIDRRTVAQVASVPEARRALDGLTGTGRKAGALAVALVLALGAIAMAGIMLSRFEAKARNLAIFRAMGFNRAAMGALLLWEGLLLGTAGCALGALFDAALFPWLRSLMGTALPPARESPSHVWESWPVWAAGLAAALLASFFHFHRSERADPRESLQGLS
jgi:putative ABC transport system permease protein